MKTLDKMSKGLLIFTCFVLSINKFLLYSIIKSFTEFGLTKDSIYYHELALGDARLERAVNYWPTLLNHLYNIGLYNREVVNFSLLLISMFMLPYMIIKIALQNISLLNVHKTKFYCLVYLVTNLYINLFLCSLDILREIPMILLFLIAIYWFSSFLREKGIKSLLWLFLYIAISVHLYEWREYLSVSLLLAPFVFYLAFKLRPKVHTLFFIFLLLLSALYVTGVLNPVLEYRGVEGFESGDASLGIGLINKHFIVFIVMYLYSTIVQFFGFYFVSIEGVTLFLFESLPFIIVVNSIRRNWRGLNKFCYFIICFFFSYLTIWSLGTDNIGTAMRLRTFNYISVFIIFLIVKFSSDRPRV